MIFLGWECKGRGRGRCARERGGKGVVRGWLSAELTSGQSDLPKEKDDAPGAAEPIAA